MVFPAPVGTDSFTFTLTDGTNDLSTDTFTKGVVSGIANNVTITLDGIAKTSQITLSDPDTTHVTGTSNAYRIIGASPHTFTATYFDASGATIIGPGTPSLSSPSGSVVIRQMGQTNTYTVQVKSWSDTAIVLTAGVNASGAPVAVGSIATIEELWVSDCEDNGGPRGPAVRAYALEASGGPPEPLLSDTIPSDASGGEINCAENLAVTPTGDIWVTDFYGTHAYEFHPGSQASYHQISDLYRPTGIAVDNAGSVWVASRDAPMYDGTAIMVQAFAQGNLTAISADTIRFNQKIDYNFVQNSLVFDKTGDLWVGSNFDDIAARVYIPGQTTPIVGDDILKQEASYDSFCMAIDSTNHLWIGNFTNGQVLQYTKGNPKDIFSLVSEDGIGNTTGVVLSGNDKVWVANDTDHILTSYNKGSKMQNTADQVGGFNDIGSLAVSP